MKKYVNYLRINILFMIFTACVLESVAQSYSKIDYPYVGSSSVDYVYIKSLEFTDNYTRVDFITCYKGNYVFLEKPGQRNAMYIRIGNKKYKLQSTYGIASADRVTICQPGQLLEFTAFFDPIPEKERDNFDLIEGIDGGWNFYGVSISKYLSRHKVPDLVEIGKTNWEKNTFKEVTIENPYVESQSSAYIILMKIEKLIDCTKIYFYYKTPRMGWINFSKNTYIQTLDGKKYKVLKSEGIPLSPDVYNFNKKGETVTFCLTFPKLPDYINSFSLYEPIADGFSFNNVELRTDYINYRTKWDNMENYFNGNNQKHKQENAVKKSNNTVKKKLKKDPNFKIE